MAYIDDLTKVLELVAAQLKRVVGVLHEHKTAIAELEVRAEEFDRRIEALSDVVWEERL
jgi:hypothetical protein